MRRFSTGVAYRGLALAWLLWLSLVILAPWSRHQDWWPSPFVYAFFHQVCHQMAERSFHVFGHPLAVCHRCFGLYLGFGVGLLVLPHLQRIRTRLTETPPLVALFFVPLLADVAWSQNTELTRFATGLVAALPMGLLAWLASRQIARPLPLPSTQEDR